MNGPAGGAPGEDDGGGQAVIEDTRLHASAASRKPRRS